MSAMKQNNPIWTFAKKHRGLALLSMLLITLPFSVSLIQWLVPYRCIVMTPAEFVLFYGTTGSVVWGVCAYVLQKTDKKAEKEREFKPDFTVEPVKAEPSNFEVMITNASAHGVKDVYLFDKRVASFLPSEESLSVAIWNAPGFELFATKLNALTGVELDCEFDDKGYPAHITIVCEDLINRIWALYFKRQYSSGQYSYLLEKAELVVEEVQPQ